MHLDDSNQFAPFRALLLMSTGETPGAQFVLVWAQHGLVATLYLTSVATCVFVRFRYFS